MPHGGYHGTVKIGNNVVQTASQNPNTGQYEISGGIDDSSRLDFNPPQSNQNNQNINQQIEDKKKEIELLNVAQSGFDANAPGMGFPMSGQEGKLKFTMDPKTGQPAFGEEILGSVPFNIPDQGFTGVDAKGLATLQNIQNQQLNNLLIQQAQAEARDRILAGATIPSVDVEQGFGNTGVLRKADLTGFEGGPFGLNIPALGATPSIGMSGIETLENPYTEEILFSTDPNNLGSRQDELLKARLGLTTPQYNTFISDLYDANPELYQETFPFASGQIAKPILARIGEGIMGLPGASQIGQLASSVISPLSGLFTGQSTATPTIQYDNMGNPVGIISQLPESDGEGVNLQDFVNTPKLDLGQYSAIPEKYKGFFESEFAKPVAGGMAITYVTLPDGRRIRFGDTGSAAQFRKYLESIGVAPQEEPTEKVEVETPKEEKAPFDYASIAPQFTGSQYTNQGVSPAFLENLRRFYG